MTRAAPNNVARLALAVALAAAIALAAAGSAQAAAPSGQISSPGEHQELAETAAVAVAVSFSAPSQTGEITNVGLSLRSVRSGRVQTQSFTVNAPTFSHTWSTFEPGLLDYNGEYRIRAEAGYRDPLDPNATAAILTRSFYLAVPPVAPAGVTAAVNSSSRTVAVSWTGNPEPDLLGYLVERAPEDGPYQHLAEIEPGQTTYTDDVTDLGGDYSYRVVALREGAADLNANPERAYEALNSDPSAPASATVASPPTTTSESTTSGVPQEGDGGAVSTSDEAAKPAIDAQGRVNLSGFAALLDQARARPPTRATLPDAGFSEDLPYGTRPPTTGASTTADRSGVEIALADDDAELGDDERLRSMAFLAGGLFAFVLLMHLVWIRSEVNHAPLDVDVPDEPSDELADPPDLPEPPNGASSQKGDSTLGATPRKRSQGARGAAHRVPQKSRGDRREGRPTVRAGR